MKIDEIHCKSHSFHQCSLILEAFLHAEIGTH